MSTFSAYAKTLLTSPSSAHLASLPPSDKSLPPMLPTASNQNFPTTSSLLTTLLAYLMGIPLLSKPCNLPSKFYRHTPMLTPATHRCCCFLWTHQSIQFILPCRILQHHCNKFSRAPLSHHPLLQLPKHSLSQMVQWLMVAPPMEEGVTQGCSLSPLFTSFVVTWLLEMHYSMPKLLPGLHMGIPVMISMAASPTFFPMSMTSPHVSTSPTSSSFVTPYETMAHCLDALSTLPKHRSLPPAMAHHPFN
jgi:hypothetical protein